MATLLPMASRQPPDLIHRHKDKRETKTKHGEFKLETSKT
jgi:hypothetical protein